VGVEGEVEKGELISIQKLGPSMRFTQFNLRHIILLLIF
jgi:hypothetical protein